MGAVRLACANAVTILHDGCPDVEGQPEILSYRLCLNTPFGTLMAVDLWINRSVGFQVVFLVVEDDGWVEDVYMAPEGSSWNDLERLPFENVREQLEVAIASVNHLRQSSWRQAEDIRAAANKWARAFPCDVCGAYGGELCKTIGGNSTRRNRSNRFHQAHCLLLEKKHYLW